MSGAGELLNRANRPTVTPAEVVLRVHVRIIEEQVVGARLRVERGSPIAAVRAATAERRTTVAAGRGHENEDRMI